MTWQATANDGAQQGQKMNFTGIGAQMAQQNRADRSMPLGAQAVRQSGEVSSQIESIEMALNLLENSIQELIQRLLPVIAQQTGNQAATPQEPPCITGIGEKLRAIRDRIDSLQNFVSMANGGLEL